MKKFLLALGLILVCHGLYGQIRLVFRCDDYRMRDDSLQEKILDVFSKYNVPLNICIIPADTTSREVFSLSDPNLKKWISLRDKGLLDIGLHGFMHADLNPKYGRWNEFENLSYEEQVDRFSKGREIIETHLGGKINYFVPPRNVINDNTTKALRYCGFDILSANVTNRMNGGLEGIVLYPCTTEDFSDFVSFYYNGRYEKYKDGTIILLFHAYTFTEGRYTFEKLENFLSSISVNADFKICTFNQLLKQGVPGYDRGLQNKPYSLLKKIYGDDLFFLNNPSINKVDVVYFLLYAILGVFLTIPFMVLYKRRRLVTLIEVTYLILIGIIVFTLPIGFMKAFVAVVALGIITDGAAIIKRK